MMSFAQWGNALYSGDKSYAVVPKRKVFVGLAAAKAEEETVDDASAETTDGAAGVTEEEEN